MTASELHLNDKQLISRGRLYEAAVTQNTATSQIPSPLGVIKQPFVKVKETILLTSLYAVLVVAFGFWWAENFHDYTHFKGDESFFEIEVVGVITFIAFIVFRFINRKFAWWFMVTMPFLLALLSIFVTLLLPFSGLIGGTTLDNLRFYGVVHTVLTIITVSWQLLADRRNIQIHA